MNRLIIVGNGFDLAHKLPTGYCDFIDWYWKEIINNLSNSSYTKYNDNVIHIEAHFDRIVNILIRNKAKEDFKGIISYSSLQTFIYNCSSLINYGHRENVDICDVNFQNEFFKAICTKHSIQNWVDIENEYYKLLKKILKDETKKEDDDKESNNKAVIKLNEEFEQVKNLLEKYLSEEVVNKYKFHTPNDKLELIISNFFYQGREIKRLLEEFPKKDKEEMEADLYIKGNHNNFQITRTHVLSFNYTSLIKELVNRYAEEYISVNTIHGELNNSKNPINFGFGDEMDKSYQDIEDSGDGEFLKYIKSFAYFNTDNYKQLLDFIDSDKFQVYIMGHSCGLSDRILLNTIFEHDFCRSIKIFYHKDGEKDNFTEIAQNISRHFKKKDSMRMKIVNKTLCEPMPQMQLPLKD